jgi:GNAT superfamily N-acetyltransferase
VIRVEAFDARSADEATAAAYCDLVASTAGWVPEGLRVPGEYLLNDLRHVAADARKHVWLAYSGAALVGAAELQWWEAPDNRDRAWLHFETLSDEPLDALLDAVRSVAGPAGRTLLNIEGPEGSPVSSWVGLRGGKLGSIEEHNVTRLASLSRDDLASLARVPEGYELLVFDGPAPEEIVEPYVRLSNAMNDAPRDDLTMEDWTFSTERLRAWEAVVEARGHDVWTVVARSASTGELAGFNQLVLRPEWPESIQNEDTGVARAHRGHGLGLCVKAANLLRVVEERPSAVVVETWNAASNAHMLRVNRRLGFVCEHRWESWELTTPS